ncbi:hypothetical protein KP003_14590 [Geomonas nitrogeniifigens]|uniref:hypothetical protein n=1 Tax=Geomonas diazotrophica TaxID=2843197 RepID=UPI001C2BC266|nr:hypothetical protein [Geomonas nitrogeniifigens]QXE85605.1 hypothetical protein KP003_14590 [Geomonas nitrogeniifigens]
MKRLSLLTLTLCTLVFLVSCSKPEDNLPGKWVGATGSLTFKADKTGVMSLPEGAPQAISIPFTWEVKDKTAISFKFPHPVSKVVTGKFESKKVILLEDDKFIKQ